MLLVLTNDMSIVLTLEPNRELLAALFDVDDASSQEIEPTFDGTISTTVSIVAALKSQLWRRHRTDTTDYADIYGHAIELQTMEMQLLALTVLRNLSAVAENQVLIGRDPRLLNILARTIAVPMSDVDQDTIAVRISLRENSLALLQYVGAHVDFSVMPGLLMWIMRTVSGALDQGFNGYHSATPTNAAVVETGPTTGVWQALDILHKMTSNPRTVAVMNQMPREFLNELVRRIFMALPHGEVLQRGDRVQAGVSALMQPHHSFEIVTLETALIVLNNMTASSTVVCGIIASDMLLTLVIVRALTGLCWSSTPVFVRDPSLVGTPLYAGVSNLMAGSVDRERSHQIRNDVSKIAAAILLHMVEDGVARTHLQALRFGGDADGWGSATRNWYEPASSGITIGDGVSNWGGSPLEWVLLGMVFNSKVPGEISRLVAETLSHMAEDGSSSNESIM